MIELPVTLTSTGGAVSFASPVKLGYTKNKGVYRLLVTAEGEWEGLTIRCFWHLPGGTDPASSLVQDGFVDVPASVTAQPGTGCITFEGSDGEKTVTSADLRYKVGSNSGTEDGTMPEPGTPAWEQLVSETSVALEAVQKQIGNLDDLTTKAKETLVAAINEAARTGSGGAGSITMRTDGGYIQYSTDDGSTWENLIALAELKGEPGEKGADGAPGQNGADGAPGADGYSPTASVEQSTDGAKITITDKSGTTEAVVKNGKDGANGRDGVNGQPGKDGTDGITPTIGDNGNWFLGATDTGKPSRGATGDTGTDGKDAPQIDDTAITTTNPWSSKRIIDMLCPPLEESGNPVVCYPVAGYPLGVKAKWEPVQEGSGTPSSENIRPIKGRDSVTVERCGENLLHIKPFNKDTYKGITYEYVPDGGIHISGTATTSADSPTFPVWHLPPGKYYGLDTGAGISASFVVQRNGKYLWLNSKGIFEILAGDVTKYWYMIAVNGLTLDTTIYPYIVSGTTAPTTYKPYISQTNTLTIPETVYGGEVDAVTGDGKRTWGIIDNYAGETIPKEWISDRDVYSADKNPTVGAQVAYRLAEPVPFTATGAQPLPALAGLNTVLTDADSATVTGRADPIKRITDLENKECKNDV